MDAYVINSNDSSNNLPCYPLVINLSMLSIGGQGGKGGCRRRSKRLWVQLTPGLLLSGYNLHR